MNFKLTNDPDMVILLPSTFVNRNSYKWLVYEEWLDAGNTPSPADPIPSQPPVAQWEDFNKLLLANQDWQTVSSQIEAQGVVGQQIVIGIASTAANANPPGAQSAINIAKTFMAEAGQAIPQEILTSWQAIADSNNIPITF